MKKLIRILTFATVFVAFNNFSEAKVVQEEYVTFDYKGHSESVNGSEKEIHQGYIMYYVWILDDLVNLIEIDLAEKTSAHFIGWIEGSGKTTVVKMTDECTYKPGPAITLTRAPGKLIMSAEGHSQEYLALSHDQGTQAISMANKYTYVEDLCGRESPSVLERKVPRAEVKAKIKEVLGE